LERRTRLNGVELPSFTEHGLEQLVGFRVVRKAHLLRVVLELALVTERNHTEQHPFDERRRDIEVRAGRIAAFAGADEIAHVAGGAGEQGRRHTVVLHLLYREQPRHFPIGASGHHALVADKQAAIGHGEAQGSRRCLERLELLPVEDAAG
jgi:hypothetical protein